MADIDASGVAQYHRDGVIVIEGLLDDATRLRMKQVLADIQTGEYAKSFILENRAGAPTLLSRRRLMAEHSIEVVGEQLRAMMPWIKANKLVDKSKN